MVWATTACLGCPLGYQVFFLTLSLPMTAGVEFLRKGGLRPRMNELLRDGEAYTAKVWFLMSNFGAPLILGPRKKQKDRMQEYNRQYRFISENDKL
jgi:hypothetical protein